MYTSALRSLRRLMLAAAPPPRRHLAHAATRSNAQDSAASETHTSARQQLQQQRQRQRLGQPAADGVAASTDAPAPICSTTSAVGQVMAAQANFVRVKVDALEGGEPGEVAPQARLLCVVRALLKKMRREVLVGDRVRLVGIDWTDGRGGFFWQLSCACFLQTWDCLLSLWRNNTIPLQCSLPLGSRCHLVLSPGSLSTGCC